MKNIIKNTAAFINAKDLARILECKGIKIAGGKAALAKKGEIAAGLNPPTIAEKIKGKTPEQISELIKETITTCPTLSSSLIAKLYNVSTSTIGSYKAHITMGHTTKVSKAVKVTKKIKVVNTKTYEGEKKRERRLSIVDTMNKEISDKPVLSLPSDNLYMERLIRQEIDLDIPFHLVENNIEKFQGLRKNLKEGSFNYVGLNLCNLEDILKTAHKNQYRDIIADYCRAFVSHRKEIEITLINKIIVKGGILAMTFCRRGQFPKELKQYAVGKSDANNEIDILKSVTNYFNSFTDYKLITVETYSDKNEDGKPGAKMVLFIMKRIK